jgi:molybdopterin synthase sulfur carrier subunit
MTIRVKFFASLREQFEKSDVQIELDESKTVAQVWALVCDEMPLPSHILMAVNMEYVNPNTPVKDGDEIAFFPPVTGG